MNKINSIYVGFLISSVLSIIIFYFVDMKYFWLNDAESFSIFIQIFSVLFFAMIVVVFENMIERKEAIIKEDLNDKINTNK